MCFKQRKDCLQVKSPIWVPALTECCQSQRSIQLALLLIPTSDPKRYVQVTMTGIPVFGWSRKICSTCNDTNSNILSSKRYLQLSVVWVPACTKVKDVLTHVSAPMPTLVHVIVTHCCICVLLSHISCFSQISILISASLFSSHACFVRRCDCISAGVCAWHLQRCQEDTKRAKTDIIFDINNDNWQFNRALCALSAIKRFFFYWKSSCRVSIV